VHIFFYELGRRLGISKIAEHAQAFGPGLQTGIDLPASGAGVMPSPEWKMKTRRSKWYAGETISVSIGQGAVSVTPMADAPRRERPGNRWPAHDSACAVARQKAPEKIL